MTQGSNWLHFFYDGQGQPAEMNFNGTVYIYVKNLQGDIIGIVDTTGRIVVEYKYDAWGRPTYSNSLVDSSNSNLTARYALMLTLNPFRYRGYVYDNDTELYYLVTRYYSSRHCRFISEDIVTDNYKSVIHNNLYSYCLNSPLVFADYDGRFALLAFGFGTAIAAIAETFALAFCYTACVVTTVITADVVIDTTIDNRRKQTSVQETVVANTATATVSAQKRKRPTKHIHHIVAKKDWRASPARMILESYGINVMTDPRNLVPVDAEIHACLHTNEYYRYVNMRLIIANRGGKNAVLNTMRELRAEILIGSIIR